MIRAAAAAARDEARWHSVRTASAATAAVSELAAVGGLVAIWPALLALPSRFS